MAISTPPTSQKAGARPISFVLDDRAGGSGPSWVPLVIRPEDLTRTEPARVATHQTLGRDVIGWSDHFGAGLPNITISGHTGWRQHSSYGDGAREFERLNQLVARDYPDAKQRAIDTGRDPGLVRLIFVDNLNNAVWTVEPTTFVLRRSKSRPLLYQYNIVMNAIDTRASAPVMDLPFLGDAAAGMNALDRVLGQLGGFSSNVEGWVNDALRGVEHGWAPIGGTVREFMDVSNRVFSAVDRTARAINGGISGVGNILIGTAGDLAMIGTNVFRSISAVASIPYNLQHTIGRVASSYQEAYCIFRNSLRPRRVYDDYGDLFGASNCSSTTGGRPFSAFSDTNVFDLAMQRSSPVSLNESALSAMSALRSYDPVSYQITPAELNRYLGNVVQGFGGVTV